jgi:hypothetical protein
MDMNIHPILIKRLEKWWPLPEDEVYYSLLAAAFPILKENYAIPLDESGPELYRRKLNNTLLLVLQRETKHDAKKKQEKNQTWILIVTTDWINTHNKITLPRWILEQDLKHYSRYARNELLLESFRA